MNATIVRLGVRSLLGRRRGLMLFILPVILIVLAFVVRGLTGGGADAAAHVLPALGLHVLLPLIALIAASSLLAPEIDDGSVVYLLAKPISRLTVVASKLLIAVGCTVVFAVVPILIAGFVLATDEPGLVLAYAIGALAGGAAYCALFTWLSTLTRHAVVIGLIYVLLWEGLIGGLVGGVRWVSISWWSSAIAEAVSDRLDLVSPDLGAPYAVIATLVVLVGFALLAARRLQGFNLTGDE
jgi:ABC-2 type transport system permease protein